MHDALSTKVILGLGWLYLILFCMNAWWAYRSLKGGRHVRISGQNVPTAAFWAFYCGLLSMVALAHFTGAGNPETFLIRLPHWAEGMVNKFADPISYFTASVLLFVVLIVFRKLLVNETVAWILLNAGLLFMFISITNKDFREIVGKPDNVPIVSMLFIVAFFTWLYFKRAVDNDERIAVGKPLFEQENNGKVLVWPDLVYAELICMVVLTAVLVLWGIALQAPLEEPASAVRTPNPSKAPWYFLGLQEMLVYFDPWLAGVVLPSMILVGLMAIPYIDFNKKGNGYYTFTGRPFAVITFMFGFLPLWLAMIVLGTFLRGPNWNFFGIYEYWDVHKLEVLNNVNLSEWFWVDQLERGLPIAAADAGKLEQSGMILLREAPGIVLTLAYLIVAPPIMAATLFKKFYYRMGFIRFMVFANLLLMMASLPIKMLLRWTLNWKYIVAIPEWFFNI